MRYLVDGLPVPLSTAVGIVERACEAAGVSLTDVLPDGINAAAQSEWGRELVNELSGYRVECIATEWSEQMNFYPNDAQAAQ